MLTCVRVRLFILFASLVVLMLGFVVSANAAAPPEPDAVANALWNKLLTHCGESYFYSGSFFDQGGMLSSVGAGSHPTVIEFRGVKFHLVPVHVTDAERMNGQEYRARMTMMAHLYRDDGGDWIDGPDFQPRNINDVMGKALQSVMGDAGQLGDGGSIAFELVKYKGKWAVARSSTNMSGPLTFGTDFYDLDKVVSARGARYQCATGKVSFTPKEQATIEAETAAKAKAERAASDQAIRAVYANVPIIYISPEQYQDVLIGKKALGAHLQLRAVESLAPAFDGRALAPAPQSRVPFGAYCSTDFYDADGFAIASSPVEGQPERHFLIRYKDCFDLSEASRQVARPKLPFALSCKSEGAPEVPGPATPYVYTVEDSTAVPYVTVPGDIAADVVANISVPHKLDVLKPFATDLASTKNRLAKGTSLTEVLTFTHNAYIDAHYGPNGKPTRPGYPLVDANYIRLNDFGVMVPQFGDLFTTGPNEFVLVPMGFEAGCS